MKIFSSFRSSSEAIVVEGADIASAASSSKTMLFSRVSFLVLLIALLFSWWSTGDALADRASFVQQWYQFVEQKKVEQQNKEALQALLVQKEALESDYELFSQALPDAVRYEQVLQWLEQLFFEIRQQHFVDIPELIAWRPVPARDVSNPALQELGMLEINFSVVSDYEAFMKMMEAFRQSLRMIDVRSIRNLKQREDGLISADLQLWSYYLPLSF